MKNRFHTIIYIVLIVMACFTIQSQTIVTSYFENFNNPIDLNLWNPDTTTHEDGSPVFDISQSGGVLHADYNQKDYTDGQGYNFTKNKNIVFNLSANPYVSFDMKIEEGATYNNVVVDSVSLEVSPFAPDSITGEMSHLYRFRFFARHHHAKTNYFQLHCFQ